MPLSHIEHFLVQTESIEKTRDWYVRVLGMEVGPNPDFKFPVCWLYLGGKDIVHITEGGAKAGADLVVVRGHGVPADGRQFVDGEARGSQSPLRRRHRLLAKTD